jgi:ubiquinone/menaquinone biosynthesis C-methylase UbiE
MSAIYDGTTGYSSLDAIDVEKTRYILTVNKEIIEECRKIREDDRLLVAGAGSGVEAVVLNRVFGTRTFAVDLNIDDSVRAQDREIIFDRQDLAHLAFGDDQFDYIYCVHVLEHVSDHTQVLSELHRVLKTAGVMFIGFPNKNRLVGYVGTNDSATTLQKIRWNLHDYADRIGGRFENRLGAHAGFTQKEFLADAGRLFSKINLVRNQYMLRKYPKYDKLVRILIATGMAEIAFPSNYFVCIK